MPPFGDKKRTIRLAVGAVVYAIGMALTVFAKLPTLAELAFLIVAYAHMVDLQSASQNWTI